MSLEPITKKDIENLFNKILRMQINRHTRRDSRINRNLGEEQIVQEEESRFRGKDELVGLKTKNLVFKNEENENLENKKLKGENNAEYKL